MPMGGPRGAVPASRRSCPARFCTAGGGSIPTVIPGSLSQAVGWDTASIGRACFPECCIPESWLTFYLRRVILLRNWVLQNTAPLVQMARVDPINTTSTSVYINMFNQHPQTLSLHHPTITHTLYYSSLLPEAVFRPISHSHSQELSFNEPPQSQ
jgi:hypothetical protein